MHAADAGADSGGIERRDFRRGSIPAIFAVTTDPFIVLTSNLLRSSACVRCISCWQVWQSVFDAQIWSGGDSGVYRYQDADVDFYHIPIAVSLGVVFGILV